MNGRCSAGCLIALLLAGCHDAPRRNPLDPELTPAVTVLRAEMDPAQGAVLLEWTPYQGRQPFAEYRVLRKVRGLEQVDTVAVIAWADSVRLTDTHQLQPDAEYLYRVAVVNRAGYVAESEQVSAGAFTVSASHLLAAVPDSLLGQVRLSWSQYVGPGFQGYGVWRRRFGQESELLAALTEATTTTWTDTTAVPEVEYSYWLTTAIHGRSPDLESSRLEVSYRLAPVRWVRAAITSRTAKADLAWTAYQGPHFAAYQVRRRADHGPEEVVAQHLTLVDTTTVDGPLDGNTEYQYRIVVLTTWSGQQVEVESPPASGGFYRLAEVRPLPKFAGQEEVQGIGLAVDQTDRLHAAVTSISTTTAKQMSPGVRLWTTGNMGYTSYLSGFRPERLSPVQLVATQDRLFLAVTATEANDPAAVPRIQVVAIDLQANGLRQLWQSSVPVDNLLPVGLWPWPNGGVAVIDEGGIYYPFGPTGEGGTAVEKLATGLESQQALPVRHAVVGPAAGLARLDGLFLIAPDRNENRLVARSVQVRDSTVTIGGRTEFGDGVGLAPGQSLSPLTLAFDPSTRRLIFLEARGSLQVLEAELDLTGPRSVTQWGRFGSGAGEFLLSPPTTAALAVDSAGRVYVADGEARVQVFAP